MATAVAGHISTGQTTDNGFFSRIQSGLGNISGIVGNVGELWQNTSPIWSDQENPPGGPPIDQPTYNGKSNVQTPTTRSESTNNKNLLIIGGVILAAVLLLR